jgi:hypothetical protein
LVRCYVESAGFQRLCTVAWTRAAMPRGLWAPPVDDPTGPSRKDFTQRHASLAVDGASAVCLGALTYGPVPTGVSSLAWVAGVSPGQPLVNRRAKMQTDTDLRDAVVSELGYERGVASSNVRVSVDNGYVTLSGVLASPEQRAAAERAAMRVTGIVGVNSELGVSLSDQPIITPN